MCCVQAPESYLATRFSGNWEDSLVHDSHGRIFLDFDPYCFQEIVVYLRQRAIDTEPVPYPAVQPNKQHMFNKLVQYLCLDEYMGKPQEPCQIKFTASHPEIALQLEGYHAISTAVQPGYRSAIIGSPLPSSTKLILDCEVTCAGWLFLGIVCNHDDVSTALDQPMSAFASCHTNNDQQGNAQVPFLGPVLSATTGGIHDMQQWGRQRGLFDRHTYGWSSAREEFIDGEGRAFAMLPKWNSGDRVGLEVDPASGHVHMRHLKSNSTKDFGDAWRQASLRLPDNLTGYSVQAVLMSHGDAVHILPTDQNPVVVSAAVEDWVRV